MDAQRKTLIRLSQDAREGYARVAAKGNFNKMQGKAPPQFGGDEQQPGGGQPFEPKGGAGNINAKRQIPDDHQFDKKAIKPIVKTLWAMSVALGHALTAHRQFSRLKSSTFSPDGMLGGKGYIMPIKEIRQTIFEACENLSGLVDTLHDEINAPHWKPKLADLEKADMAEVERLLSDAEEWIDNPEEETEEQEEGIAGGKENARWTKERFKEDGKEPRSDVPGGGDKETTQKVGPHPASPDHPNNKSMKQASGKYAYDRRTADYRAPTCASCGAVKIDPTFACEVCGNGGPVVLQANSSVDPGTLSGPRIDHLDRGDVDQTGPGGSYNREDPAVTDQWGEQDGVSGEPMSQDTGDAYAYPSDWSGNESNHTASSTHPDEGAHGVYNPHAVMPGDSTAPLGDRSKNDRYETVEDTPEGSGKYDRREGASGVPDSNSDGTPGEGFDWGIGDGNGDDAHGQAAGGYGEGNPGSPDSNPGGGTGNMGVFGPRADLPDDPGGSTKDRDESDTIPLAEQGIGNSSVPTRVAARFLRAVGKLPNDHEDPVARSDYYWGDKGNDFNFDKNKAATPEEAQSRTPGNNAPQPPAPLTTRPMHLQEWEFAAGSTPDPIAGITTDPVADSAIPGDDSPEGTYDSAPGYSPDEYHRTEQISQPYVKYDDDTHNMKPDNTYQRGDLPAPYVNQTTP